ANPARTDPDRVSAPATTASAAGSASPARPAATTRTTPSAAARAASSDQSTTRRPASGSYCLWPPNRRPAPAATTMAHTRPIGAGGYRRPPRRPSPGRGVPPSLSFCLMSPTDLLAGVDLFADLTPQELRQLADASTIVELHRGDVLFHEDDPGDTVYIV